ncbi:MAG: riboflavin biosynthesis protein RibF [Clostridia bacterium]|nr:riboflavin biosynthesis protein RibF [Clostridia bacterium]
MKEMFFDIEVIMLNKNASLANGCVIAVGGFDGVHLGHRAMLSALTEEAKRQKKPAAVFSFALSDRPKGNTALLASEDEKHRLLAESGVDAVYIASFSQIKNMTAEDFVLELLYKRFGAASVICGYDFRFGSGRKGDFLLIKSLLSDKGVSVVTPDAVTENGVPVSSTAIRTNIREGRIEQANKLLGRRFCFTAEIIKGRQLGRKLGFPTANQKYPSSLVSVRFGVYAVVCRISGKEYGGVANIGIKPTVDNCGEVLCETYLFGYNGDCYGEEMKTELVSFIRPEQKFDSLDLLRAQVDSDKETAKKLLKEYGYNEI